MPKSLKYILKKMNKILINLPSTEILRTNRLIELLIIFYLILYDSWVLDDR